MRTAEGERGEGTFACRLALFTACEAAVQLKVRRIAVYVGLAIAARLATR